MEMKLKLSVIDAGKVLEEKEFNSWKETEKFIQARHRADPKAWFQEFRVEEIKKQICFD